MMMTSADVSDSVYVSGSDGSDKATHGPGEHAEEGQQLQVSSAQQPKPEPEPERRYSNKRGFQADIELIAANGRQYNEKVGGGHLPPACFDARDQ